MERWPLTNTLDGSDLVYILDTEESLNLEHDNCSLVRGLDVVRKGLAVDLHGKSKTRQQTVASHDGRAEKAHHGSDRGSSSSETVEAVRKLGVGRELGPGDDELRLLLRNQGR